MDKVEQPIDAALASIQREKEKGMWDDDPSFYLLRNLA